MPRNWIKRLSQRLANASTRRRTNNERRQAESLEQRVYLTVTSLFADGHLQILSDAQDDIVVGADAATGRVQVTVNGTADPTLGAIQASTVRALTVFGSDTENLIDLSGVTAADFSFFDVSSNAGLQITVEGDDGNDTIIGSLDLGGTLNGGNGADTIIGQDGGDSIDGGDGADSITAGAGNDTVIGDDGDDFIDAGDGSDLVNSGDGQDSVNGGTGDDTINSGDGSDTVDGGAGADSINGMSGVDSLIGGTGNDTLFGGSENDIIDGGDGDDFLNGQAGNDTVNGNAGNDIALGGGGRDSLLGGDGDDILNGQSGNDTLAGEAGMDRIYGGSSNDVLDGGDDADTVLGHGGDDTLTGGGGADLLNGGSGNDRVEGVGSFTPTPSSPVVVPLASINDVTQAEGAGNTAFIFTVTLNAVPTQTVTVDFTVADGTAQAGSDFVAAAGTVTFAAGVTSQTITVTVTGDANPEDDERFLVNLIASATVALQDGQGIGTVLNDDGLLPFGQPLNFDQFADPNDGLGGFRWTTTATDGAPGFAQGDPVTLTWGIVPDGTLVPVDGNIDSQNTAPSDLIARLDTIYMEPNAGQPNVMNRNWFSFFQQVFDRYQEISGLTYTFEAFDDGVQLNTANIGMIGIRPDVRIGGTAIVIPGFPNVLAFDGFPNGSDMVIDTVTTFFDNTSQNSLRLRNFIAHEHGHGLGQRHVLGDTNALMHPIVPTLVDGPQEIDILSTQRQYGDPLERGAGNDTVAGATPLGIVNASIPAMSPDNVSIDDDSDIDVYQITVATDLTVSINLTPMGSTNLNVGPQSDPNNLNPGTTLNARTLSDLGLELVDSDGTTVLASSFGGGFGQSEAITGFTVPSAGNYFVRITGSENSIQAYSLSVTAATNPATGDLLPDTLIGGSGNDTLIGADSDDLLNGGDGNDSIDGGGGNDSILGGSGNDTLNGQAGNDTLDGQGGDDVLNGGDGDDVIVFMGVGDGDDTIATSEGGDTLVITGDSSDETFSIGQSGGSLVISEGAASVSVMIDGISGGVENVVLNAGGGDDTVTISSVDQVGFLFLTVNGEDGNDTISAAGASLGGVRLLMDGGAGDDTITGSSDGDTITGGDGDDMVSGGDGNDTLRGGLGNDVLAGGNGNDLVEGEDGNDTLQGDAGNDSLLGSFGNDNLTGGDGNDTARGGFGDDSLNGMAGDDSLFGDTGRDRIAGGSGDDRIDGGRDDDTIQGHSGNDLIDGNHGNDSIVGQAGDDTILGDDGNDTIAGGDGRDLILGQDGDDIIDGNAGSDTLPGGDGNDILRGGGSDDTILGEDGDDTINGGSGNDLAATGEGNDSVSEVETIDESFTLPAALLSGLDA